MFCLTRLEFRRWLQLEAQEQRSPACEAELRGYLDAITAAERQVRRWVVTYLRSRRSEECGATKEEIYRAVAPRLPAVWGARMAARVHVRCHRDKGMSDKKTLAVAGKMLILEEALLALCSFGRVEAVYDPAGAATFRWCPAPVAQPTHRAGKRPPSAAGCRGGLLALLASGGAFVGFDE